MSSLMVSNNRERKKYSNSGVKITGMGADKRL